MLFPCFRIDGLIDLLNIISGIWMFFFFFLILFLLVDQPFSVSVSFKYTCPYLKFCYVNHNFTWEVFDIFRLLLCGFSHSI
jgi:hypothetical protein